MCVKEFYGYNCGHCSVANLIRCPIALADSNYPACEHPGERPIYTNNVCHPCSRVLWNKRVLEAEEDHRLRHQNGECECEVIFDQEERERRARQRALKGKGRAGEEGHSGGNGGYGRGRFEGGSRGGHRGNGGESRGGFGNRDSAPGNFRGGYNSGDSGFGSSRGGYYGVDNGGEYSRGRGGSRHMEHYPTPTLEHYQEFIEQSSTRHNWAPDAKFNAYQYVGYNLHGSSQGQDQSHGDPAHIHPTGLMMGQPGSGMKWYQEEPAMPPVLDLPPLPEPHSGFNSPAYQTVNTAFGYSGYSAYSTYEIPVIGRGLVYQKAMSEPSTTYGSPIMSTGITTHTGTNNQNLTLSTGTMDVTGNYKSNYYQLDTSTGTIPAIASNETTPTMSAATLKKDNEHVIDNKASLQPRPTVHSDAGKGSST